MAVWCVSVFYDSSLNGKYVLSHYMVSKSASDVHKLTTADTYPTQWPPEHSFVSVWHTFDPLTIRQTSLHYQSTITPPRGLVFLITTRTPPLPLTGLQLLGGLGALLRNRSA